MIPAGWGGEAIGENVLIAWNRSREARRAVNDAIPFINSASNVTILTIDSGRNPERFGTEPGANLLEHLSRHGARVEIANITSEGAPVADVILDQAAERDANLLVIGAYRSEEHTSELPSLMRISYAVFCLKKKKKLNILTEAKQYIGYDCD